MRIIVPNEVKQADERGEGVPEKVIFSSYFQAQGKSIDEWRERLEFWLF